MFDLVFINEYMKREQELFLPVTYPTVLPGKYIVGYNGTIFNVEKGFYIGQRIGTAGYYQCHLTDINFKPRDYMSHRIIAWEWVTVNRDLSMDVDHIDGVKTNNFYANLRWCTHLENVRSAFKNGLVGSCKGEHHRHILTENDVRQICELLQDPNIEYKEIIAKLGLNVSVGAIQYINNGYNWTHITKDYNLPPRNRRKPKKLL